jgi:diacylglycerol kinase (ATP)
MSQKILVFPPNKSSSAQPRRTTSFQVAHNLLVSFRYAWMGLAYAFTTQRNFRIHVVVGVLAMSLALALHLAPVELAVLSIVVGLVLAMELLNTALEAAVDLAVGSTYHELAKIAKDCAAGAVLISAMSSLLVGCLLLLPPLVNQVSTYLFP